jgi:D-glycero-alpha-D-manno-heptose 1-phosphate guanylyltransferase
MSRITVDTAIVLAGGLGTRLRGAVPDLPKPLAPINGRPFLEYLLDYWCAQGIKRFILSVGYRAEMIRSHFGHSYRNCQIDYSEEETPLGTGGALLLATGMIEGKIPVLAINGDTFFEVDLVRLQAFHEEHDSDWTFCTFSTSENGRYLGMEINPDGYIQEFRMDRNTGERLVNGGVYLFSRSILADARRKPGEKASLEDELFPALLAAGCRFFVTEFSSCFIDIGVPEDYARAPAILGACRNY